jgi:NAD+ synthase
VRKNGFHEVVLGLSGGIDSAMVARSRPTPRVRRRPRARDALAVLLARELEDATEVARRLGIRLDVLPIEEAFRAYLAALADLFEGTQSGVAEENLQARIRGNLLMALSNKRGGLVLATGNKSEFAVGYSTLYGDMAGGFAPIRT